MTRMTDAQKVMAEQLLRRLLRLSPGAPPPALDLDRVRAENEANRVLPQEKP